MKPGFSTFSFVVWVFGVTINTSSNNDGSPAPQIGKGAFFATGAKVIGNKKIGDRVSFSVDTMVYNMEIPDDSVVIRDNNGKIQINRRKKERSWGKVQRHCRSKRNFVWPTKKGKIR